MFPKVGAPGHEGKRKPIGGESSKGRCRMPWETFIPKLNSNEMKEQGVNCEITESEPSSSGSGSDERSQAPAQCIGSPTSENNDSCQSNESQKRPPAPVYETFLDDQLSQQWSTPERSFSDNPPAVVPLPREARMDSVSSFSTQQTEIECLYKSNVSDPAPLEVMSWP